MKETDSRGREKLYGRSVAFVAAHQGSKNHSYAHTNYFRLFLSLFLFLFPPLRLPEYFALIAVSVVMSLSSSKKI